MAYTAHNFQSGQPLTAEVLNEMDDQIEKNAKSVDMFTEQMVKDQIAGITLETDGEYIIMIHDDKQIAMVAIGDISNVIQCEGLTLTSGTTIELGAGQTTNITYSVTPSDCNQKVRFMTDDVGVATVTSTGAVTGIDVGNAIVSMLCGRHTEKIRCKVSSAPSPTWIVGNWLAENTDTMNRPGISLLRDSDTKLITMPYTDMEPISLKAGQKLTITVGETYYIQLIYAIAPMSDGFAYGLTWSDNMICANAEVVDFLVQESLEKGVGFTYTATQDCYICMMVGGLSNSFNDEDAALLTTDGHVTFKIEQI